MIQGCAIILGTFLGCSRIFGCLFGLFSDFWVTFLAIPGFLGIIFLVRIDFFKNDTDFWVLILILYLTLKNVACRALFLIFFSQI